MERLNRKYWPSDNYGIKNKGGFFNAIDDAVKTIYRINDEEYDHACDVLTDEEFDLFASDTNELTFTYKRKILNILNDKVYNFNRKRTPLITDDKDKQKALDWWHNLPIQNLLEVNDSWVGYLWKYYPDKSEPYNLTVDEVYYIFKNEN
jgi:hypothetical protein